MTSKTQNKLEKISWKDQKWINKEGQRVEPVKIGDSFIANLRIGHPMFVPPGIFDPEEHKDQLEKLLNNRLKEQKSLGYISNDQKKIINSYSLNHSGNQLNDTYTISFYKI